MSSEPPHPDTASTESMPGPGGGGAGHHGGGRGHHGGAGGDGPRDRGGFASGEQPGDRIGPYKLLEVIGTGGFGVVYLAERREPMVQRVALKILKPGMDSHAVIARFEQERQALAVMDHPNVAKVLDGGVTETGRPYFVMEHVKGEPITAYADRQQLTIRERLELFTSVCEAVQHAHMKGIIHRDLKPSNILVASVGERREGERSSSTGALVKVIDFGVAKAISHSLTDKTIFTEHGQLIGTPEYMSPEQAEMGATDIDTRSDVYSLGVVLYELLCGAVPFDGSTLRAAGWGAIQRIIREEEPPRPSTRLSTIDDETGAKIARARQADREKIAAELRRELEWIPLKALRKDRARRYASAESLAADVRGYLEGQPLEAAPESRTYLMRKFVRRNKGQVLAAGAVMLALAAGGSVAAWQWRTAKAQADHARDVLASLGEDGVALSVVQALEELSQEQIERINQTVLIEDFDIRGKRPSELKGHDAISVMGALAKQTMHTASELIEMLKTERMVVILERDAAREAQQQAEESARTIERNAYVANVQMAGTYRELGEWGRVRERLDAARGPHVTWEWAWLDAEADQSLFAIGGLPFTATAFSPDGTRIFTSSWDTTPRVWDTATRASLVELNGHENEIWSADFSPDGTRILTASFDGIARVWDSATGECLAELKGHIGDVIFASFSSGGTRIETYSNDNTLRVWDAATGESLAEVKQQEGSARALARNPESRLIATVIDSHRIQVLDETTGAIRAELSGHSAHVNSARFSASGHRIVTGSMDGTTRVWDTATGESLIELQGHTGGVVYTAFSPDGTCVVTQSEDRVLRIWNAATATLIAEFQALNFLVRWVVHSPDGSMILVVSKTGIAQVLGATSGLHLFDLSIPAPVGLPPPRFSLNSSRVFTSTYDGFARVWDASMRASRFEIKGHSEPIRSVAFSPDGARIVTASEDGTAQVWDATTGESLAELKGEMNRIESAAFSPNGTLILTEKSNGEGHVWDAVSGTLLAELDGAESIDVFRAFSPDGKRIVGCAWPYPSVWDATTGSILTELKGFEERANHAAFSPDSSRIVTASRDGTARVWDAATGESLIELKGHTGGVVHAAFSPDGTRIVTASEDGTARVWNAATGERLSELTGHSRWALTALFSPDGTRVVTQGEDGTTQVWDAATGVPAELLGLNFDIHSSAFSPDGTRIVTVDVGGTARVWDAATGETLAELKGHTTSVQSAAFSPDGTRIVTVSEDGTGRIWDAVPYRIRFAERYWRETGPEEMRAINLGEIYMKELRGLSEPTWLSDPTLEKYRPNFLWNPAKQGEADADRP